MNAVRVSQILEAFQSGDLTHIEVIYAVKNLGDLSHQASISARNELIKAWILTHQEKLKEFTCPPLNKVELSSLIAIAEAAEGTFFNFTQGVYSCILPTEEQYGNFLCDKMAKSLPGATPEFISKLKEKFVGGDRFKEDFQLFGYKIRTLFQKVFETELPELETSLKTKEEELEEQNDQILTPLMELMESDPEFEMVADQLEEICEKIDEKATLLCEVNKELTTKQAFQTARSAILKEKGITHPIIIELIEAGNSVSEEMAKLGQTLDDVEEKLKTFVANE